MTELSNQLINTAAESLYNSRRELGDPVWEGMSILGRAYYRMTAKQRVLREQICGVTSPDGQEKCVLVPGHADRGFGLRHKGASEWD